jgi:hypothetical protein
MNVTASSGVVEIVFVREQIYEHRTVEDNDESRAGYIGILNHLVF